MLLRFFLTSFAFIFLFSSCATFKLNSREKIYATTTVGFSGGAVYGLTRRQAKGKNALLFGSSLGLLASLIGIAVFNEEKKARELELSLIHI